MAGRPDAVNEIMRLYAAGRFAEMEARARALAKRGGSIPILDELLGIALCAQQRPAEALAPLRRAVEAEPNDPQFVENLALCQRQLGDLAGAEASLRRSLALRPSSAEARNALAIVLRAGGHLDAAEAELRHALALEPRRAAFHFNLANLLVAAGRHQEAEASFRTAIALDPRDPTPRVNLALLLADLGRFAEATAGARAVLDRIGPIDARAPERARDLADAAAGAFLRADPGAAARIYRATEGFRKSVPRLLSAYSAARRACDWELAATVEATVRAADDAFWRAEPASPFPLLMMPDLPAETYLACARRYCDQFKAMPRVTPARRASGNSRVRIGYLSSDFRDHAIAHLLVGVIEAHDRSGFEVIGYDYSPREETPARKRISAAFDAFVSIKNLSNRAAAERIAADGCDLVIDLQGWTAGTRGQLLAARPAPVQAQWLGYPGGLGASWIDYVIADRILIEPGEECQYVEKVVRLPGTYQCTDDRRTVPPGRARADYGLPEHGLVLCSFNQPFKIIPALFTDWLRLLAAVDGSVLWLLDHNSDAREVLRQRAVAHGIGAERIVWAPRMSSADHLARIACADLALDGFPYGSHTTASDMLWAGVPLIALKGATFASRVSASILAAAGLGDLVAESLDAYFDLTLAIARDAGALARLKARVAQARTSALFDTARFTRGLEAAFAAMVARQRAGLAPDHIAIAQP
ncbi:MAG TPA: tetratricopeptide repeat protein [Xanthobacteraceae bacterium]|nr:tetratricopeptide repeat protein [Xanthobacteraceae bacterium]